jgi:hypothetical protein
MKKPRKAGPFLPVTGLLSAGRAKRSSRARTPVRAKPLTSHPKNAKTLAFFHRKNEKAPQSGAIFAGDRTPFGRASEALVPRTKAGSR